MSLFYCSFTSSLILSDFKKLQHDMSRDVNQSSFHIDGNGEILTAIPHSYWYQPVIKGCAQGEQVLPNGCSKLPMLPVHHNRLKVMFTLYINSTVLY